MSPSIKRVLAAAGAISVILLGLTRIGANPVTPGLSTGFKPVMPCKAGALCVETDAGDQQVLVKLRFAPTRASPGGWKADLSNGTRLDVQPEPTAESGPLLVLTRADSAVGLAKFAWPSGVALRVWHERERLPRLKGWRVIPEKESYDSSGRALWRKTWFAISLVLLCVGAWAAIVEAQGKIPPPPAPAANPPTVRDLSDDLIRLTIAGVSVGGPQETALGQQLLTNVLLGTLTVRQAMVQVVPGLKPLEQQQLFRLARTQFIEQWQKVIKILTDHGNLLN